eukprot:CAMPEP_0174996902 /NCGR_PEP_ID=MMETSP0005-20121125/656_1 /TAXON_ID=420556 /ORGANISM="Ochromonas sp., Strain CCMP1393" /LENGTH=1589 /DNA_ID=CAMNT_0016251369 /DNA_START=19 /DNA_END=4788 /DNA_ORIENTATION=+
MDVIEASLNSRHGITTSGDACAVVHKFLRRNRHRTDTNNLIEELTRLINAGLSLSTDDVYKNILKDFSWDEQANKFGNSETLNLEKLQHALAHKSRSFIVTAASSLPNITDKSLPKRFEKTRGRTTYSFVPQLLLNHVCRRITKTGSAKLSAYSKQFPGVCLLVDISGFTKLSGHYCARGKDGIDGLQHVTNKFLGQLVEVIYAYGGDIIKFAGDAVICIFSMSKEDRAHWEQGVDQFDVNDLTSDRIFGNDTPAAATHLSIKTANSSIRSAVHPSLVLRAVECAVELREVRMDGLTVHVGISCGEICFGVLGGYNDRWECLVSGACISELSQCLDDALSQQAVLTSSCVDILRQPLPCSTRGNAEIGGEDKAQTYLSIVNVEQLPSGNYLLNSPGERDDVTVAGALRFQSNIPSQQADGDQEQTDPFSVVQVLSHIVPSMVVESRSFADNDDDNDDDNNNNRSNSNDDNLRGNNKVDLDYLGEIREVTTMFMKWDGYDAVKHRDLLSLQKCFKTTQEILSLSGAFVRQFLVDDKGCVLIACWGVPSHNHLDNAHRALCATVKIRDQLRAQRMPCSFGVTTGNVYCGTVGSTLRREYAVIGSCVDIAARLMSKAKGSLFLDTDTYSHLPANVLYTLESKKPIMLKGRSEPMHYYSYAFEGCVDLTSALALDCKARDCCKLTFFQMVHDLNATVGVLDGAAPSAVSTAEIAVDAVVPHALATDMGSGPVGHYSNAEGSHASIATAVRCVVLEGRVGCGKETSLLWLQEAAGECALRIEKLRLVPDDGLISYSLWGKIFRRLVPETFYSNLSSQRTMVEALLNEVYPYDLHAQRRAAFPAMRTALGVRCSFPEPQHRRGSSKVNSSAVGSPSEEQQVLLPRVVQEVMVRLFAHLLAVNCVLILVEGTQFTDEDSLKLLELLLHKSSQRLRSALVLAAVARTDVTVVRKQPPPTSSGIAELIICYKSGNETFRSAWFDSYRDAISKNNHSKLLCLGPIAPKEIEENLRMVLSAHEITPKLLQMVFEISGGSCFWIQEVMLFLQDYGLDTLLHLKNSANEDSRSNAPSSESPTTHPSSGGTVVSTAADASVAGVCEKSNENQHVHQKEKEGSSWSHRLRAPPICRESATYEIDRLSKSAMTHRSHTTPNSRNHTKSSSTSPTRATKMKHTTLQPDARVLELLVLHRFDKLSVIEKQLLRTASLIGEEFTQQTLVGILPRNIKPHAFHILKSLVRQRWLFVNAEDPNVYHFCHGYTHQLVYHLTPHGDREALHQSIAAYVERFYRDEPQHYLHIAQHYSHFNTEKTFEYIVKAAHYELVREQPQYESGLSMLNRALSYTSYVVDVDVILALLEQVPQNFAAISDDNLNDTLARKSNEQRLPSAATGSRAGATSGDTMSDATATGSIAHTSQPSVEAEQPPRNHKAVSCGTCFGFLFSFSGAVTPSTAESKIPSPSNVGTTGSFRRAAGAGAGAGAGSFRRGGATAGGGAGPISSVRSVHSAAESVHSYISTHSMADTRNNNANTVRSVMYAEGANDYVHMLINLLETEAEEVRVKLMEENKVQPPSIPSWQRVLLLSGRGSAGGGGGGASMMML